MSRATHDHRLRTEKLHIVGSPGIVGQDRHIRTANLVIWHDKEVYLTDKLFETLVVVVSLVWDRIDRETYFSNIAEMLRIGIDAARHRIRYLNDELCKHVKAGLPVVERKGKVVCLNVDTQSITFDMERLRDHRLDVVRESIKRLLRDVRGEDAKLTSH